MASKKELSNGKYVDDQMGNGVPSGGSFGQVLKKNSDADYDVGWGTVAANNGSNTSLILTTTGISGSSTYNTITRILNIPVYQGQITLTTTGTGAATFISNVLNIPTPPSPTFISLTTTGSSGASTLTSGVLNIPTYTLSGLGGEPIITAGTASQYWRGDKSWQTLNTAAVTESTNLYFTNTRARTALSFAAGSGAYNSTTGVITIPTAISQIGGGNWGTLNYPTWTTGTPFVKMTAVGTFSLDTNTYLTSNQTITLSGDVSGSGSTSITTAIGANKVTNTMLAQVATSIFKGRITAGTGNVEDLTSTQATSLLDSFTGSIKGLVPASAGGTTNYLRADGTWATPPGGSGGTPSGNDGNIQFNNAGSFGGDDNLEWNNTTKKLGIRTSAAGAALEINGDEYLRQNTYVFVDNFERGSGGPVSPGGSPSITYSIYNSGATTSDLISRSGSIALRFQGGIVSTASISSVTGSYASFIGLNTYSSILNQNNGTIQWAFNAQTNRSSTLTGFNSGLYGMAVVLGCTTTTPATSGNGYAVVYGGTGRNWRLVSFTGGLNADANLTTIIGSGTNDFAATEYVSVKVIYTPTTNTWRLYFRNDGTAWVDPMTIPTTTALGGTVNSTYTNVALNGFGYLYNGGATTVTNNAYYDNFQVAYYPDYLLNIEGGIKTSTIYSSGNTVSVSAGTGAGTGASLITNRSYDLSGQIILTIGTSPSTASAICNVLFSRPLSSAPKVFLSVEDSPWIIYPGSVSNVGFSIYTSSSMATGNIFRISYLVII
jgi:hypothetical protein